MSEKENTKSFEKNLAELEMVVKALEANDVPLDEMIRLFEKGVSLTKECTNALNAAEQKITVLMNNRESGELEEQPFSV